MIFFVEIKTTTKKNVKLRFKQVFFHTAERKPAKETRFKNCETKSTRYQGFCFHGLLCFLNLYTHGSGGKIELYHCLMVKDSLEVGL